MLASLEAKLIATGVFLLLLVAGAFWFGAHERAVGAAGIQAKWDAQIASQARTAVAASEHARKTEHDQAAAVSGAADHYLEAISHAQPSLADTLPGALSAGTYRLRDACPAAPASRGVSEATTHSRAADAAATQALADGTSYQELAIRAVQAGDAADERERNYQAQINALQSILRYERMDEPSEKKQSLGK